MFRLPHLDSNVIATKPLFRRWVWLSHFPFPSRYEMPTATKPFLWVSPHRHFFVGLSPPSLRLHLHTSGNKQIIIYESNPALKPRGGRSSDPACSRRGPEVGRQGHPKLLSGAPGDHLDLPTLPPKTAMIPIGNKRGKLTPNRHDTD